MDIFLSVVALIVAANVVVGTALLCKYRSERRRQAESAASSMYYAGNRW